MARMAKKGKVRRGRPESPRMPCGWECGGSYTSTEMRAHFTDCPRRPGRVIPEGATMAAEAKPKKGKA